MGAYAVERVITSHKGTVIWLRQTGKRDPKKPEILEFHDKDNNGIDRGDEVASNYDLAYQLRNVYQQMVRTKRLPKTVNGEPVVSSVDGGIKTKRKATRKDIAQWRKKLNPYLSLARKHRRFFKKRALQMQIGACQEENTKLPGTAIEVNAKFNPPLSLKTKRSRNRKIFRAMTFMGNARRLVRNPSHCNEARGERKMPINGAMVTVKISTGISLGALLSSDAFKNFTQGQRAFVEYQWANKYTITHINVR